MTKDAHEPRKVLVPARWVERIEGIFHTILGLCLLGIAMVALYFSGTA